MGLNPNGGAHVPHWGSAWREDLPCQISLFRVELDEPQSFRLLNVAIYGYKTGLNNAMWNCHTANIRENHKQFWLLAYLRKFAKLQILIKQ